jgi:hypothetical protein
MVSDHAGKAGSMLAVNPNTTMSAIFTSEPSSDPEVKTQVERVRTVTT